MRSMFIPVTPKAKARPRKGRYGFYTPKDTKDAETEIAWHVRKAFPEPLEGAVSVSLVFQVPMPKSWSNKKKEAMLGKPHIQRPDLDNFIKLWSDACNEILYNDDSQIYQIVATKVWAEKGGIHLVIL